jgi:putative ABC transport system permease protein
MKTTDILHETYLALSANKVRSGLTVLGIVIGISSVIAMLAIGQGAQSSIQSSIQAIGSNLIIVMPGAQRTPGMTISAGRGTAKSLKLSDSDAISKNVNNILGVSPEVSGRYQVTAKGTNTNTQIVGVESTYTTVRNLEVSDGDFISDQNVSAYAKVAVLGPTAESDLFGTDSLPADVIGQTIRIKSVNFKIIGVSKAKGGSGFGSQDDMIFIPITTAQRYLSGDEYVTSISVSAVDTNSTAGVQQQITDLLNTRHNIIDPTSSDFSTLNQADIASAASSITGIFTILLGSVAGISLIVGGIGIMNMMLTSVTERTREIGLRKAIGAKGRDISRQFLIEAIVLTFAGGVIGVILGWLISFGIKYFGILQTSVTVSSIFLAFGVSAIIGIIFGYYPAKRAAALNPIDALRFE